MGRRLRRCSYLLAALSLYVPSVSLGQLVRVIREPPFSQKGFNLIVDSETGGKSDYDTHPEWPGGQSGTTIAIGYDCGYTAKSVILSDWEKLSNNWNVPLSNTSGITGQRAQPLARSLRYIGVPWEYAQEVFYSVDIPRYYALMCRTYPGADKLCTNAQWAILSVIYNRGSNLIGPSRTEMQAIGTLVLKKDYAGIAHQIRSMKRLWVGKRLDGLISRREEEALLVESCKENQ